MSMLYIFYTTLRRFVDLNSSMHWAKSNLSMLGPSMAASMALLRLIAPRLFLSLTLISFKQLNPRSASTLDIRRTKYVHIIFLIFRIVSSLSCILSKELILAVLPSSLISLLLEKASYKYMILFNITNKCNTTMLV